MADKEKIKEKAMADKAKEEIERQKNKESTLRCVNCFKRLAIPVKAERYTCPNCGVEYMIGWRGVGMRQAKIKGTPIPGKHV